ncbi:MAG: PTS lactose/cellobiose transporter subunit IIA [Erysipelotrichaceae bacterium]
MVNCEKESFQLILHSGNSRSFAYEALALVKEKEFVKGNEKIEEAKNELLIAQKLHAQLLRKMANDEELNIDLLLIHAEGHISSSQIAFEMTKEFIALYERLGDKL